MHTIVKEMSNTMLNEVLCTWWFLKFSGYRLGEFQHFRDIFRKYYPGDESVKQSKNPSAQKIPQLVRIQPYTPMPPFQRLLKFCRNNIIMCYCADKNAIIQYTILIP